VTARQVREKGGLQDVWLMPNARPAHRAEPPGASPQDRLAMVRLAVRGEPGLNACDVEVRRGGPSYTIESLEVLEREHPDRSFRILLGYEVALGIRSWHEAERLLGRARMVIFNRAGEPAPEPGRLRQLGFHLDRTELIEIDSPPISAHDIRGRIKRGEPVDELVPVEVANYIRAHGLYAGRVG
jgi:nicotinate-nucleotide adenylyltransferase